MGDGRSTWSTRVRLSEVGERGAVQPHRLLEWMQEAAVDASSRAGFTPKHYEKMGASWFIREVQLAIDSPVPHGANIEIETWVSDLRRFRSRREYRVTRGGRVVARGQADWMFMGIDPATRRARPRQVGPELEAAFPRIAEHVIPDEEVPPWPDAAPLGETTMARDERKVRQSELDGNAHVNHAVYLSWLEDHARDALADNSSLTFARLEYLADARLADRVSLSVWPDRDGDYFHLVERGAQRLVRAVMRRGPSWSITTADL